VGAVRGVVRGGRGGVTGAHTRMYHAHQIPCPRKCPCPWPDNRPTSTRDCALVELREGGGKARATGSMCPCTCLYTSVPMPVLAR